MGKDRNVLVNQLTGEILGTHVTTYKKVDRGKFIKLFAENIAMTFELGSAGLKALNVLIFTVQNSGMNKDRVVLDKYALEEFLSDSGQKLSQATFTRGIKELVGAQIIARCLKGRIILLTQTLFLMETELAFTSSNRKTRLN
ncbi:hypothetical protein [Candidatus Arsenophonus triatominarum]|uniref:hypothetical protein n=1 Tax=Candidatus Arsenophonus triatominarum TaxID=57911 RepID=UPI000A9EBBEF|nr:hypothetical protein [Candidatus Arsenophonus triatominarum]